MKEEEKQRKFHEALLKMLYPPPPSPPSHQEDEEHEKKLIVPLSELPEVDVENEEGCSLPSSGEDNEDENGSTDKKTRAQRKRLRKRKLKEDASRRRNIIGPLLPASTHDGNDDPKSVRQNVTTTISGEADSCSKQNKLKKRRKSKKLAGKNLNPSSLGGSIMGTDDRS